MNYLKYLAKLDFLYKYNYKSIYHIPKLKQITTQFSISQIKETLSNLIYIDKTSLLGYLTIEIRAFCLFYLIFKIYPYITYTSVKNSIAKNYALKLNISYKSQLDKWTQLLFLNFFSKSQFPSMLYFQNINKTTFYLRCSLSSFIDSNLLFKKNFNNIKTKNFNIYIKFYIDIPNDNSIITKNKIKNLIFLWGLK